ncbi:germination protein [Clostridium tetani]|uniref:Spore peptidoglycan hydrolase (N-acetylglucosaminidase) n=1 Tax=Clostridium tetani (strain Massachusetts / E88) TaxID=212717 RepID=Q895T7_CLOTE|nr:LysM peptidoglycan-binding domain-containing protein [Clostridium tetani]AAO35753.1 spore peptidoglycan hydrolase (N-acetylglucosaminidase) [Clostridium tetani E88]AVP53635.1 LysM peptidoglycan-binding domain-containing protein [Clostridium tetani]KGI38352.1 spore gernimation protein [Clostridium tetani]KGI42800.1 spore gernimation protein [Clostridium tetani]KHO33564.1 spore gernimation protein [Clostridium tetani]
MIIHIVKPRENLWQISNYYGVPLEETIEANKLPDSNDLEVGQAIIVPVEGVFHIVRQGETLWEIAQNYNTTVEAIVNSNNIPNPSNISPGLQLFIPGVIKERPEVYVNGYIYDLGENAVPIVMEDGDFLTYLSPFAYRIKEDGSLEPIDDVPAINAAYSKNVVPMMSITNFTSTELGQNLAHVVLSSPEISENLITNIINVLREKDYRGVNIDFENVLPEDRELYNNFLQRTVDRLHPQGFFVSTALAPKTSGEQTGLLYEAHDYEAHGRIVDFVILMTYEWGYRLGPPQAISPINRIREVLDYAVTVIPKDKIYFGFQIYARDWVIPHVQGQEAQTFSIQEAIRRANRYNAVIQYDPVAQSPFYRYRDNNGVMHEVWFEDPRSAQAKFDLVKEYDLAGISYWALGFPFPQNWTLLADNFIIKKLL